MLKALSVSFYSIFLLFSSTVLASVEDSQFFDCLNDRGCERSIKTEGSLGAEIEKIVSAQSDESVLKYAAKYGAGSTVVWSLGEERYKYQMKANISLVVATIRLDHSSEFEFLTPSGLIRPLRSRDDNGKRERLHSFDWGKQSVKGENIPRPEHMDRYILRDGEQALNEETHDFISWKMQLRQSLLAGQDKNSLVGTQYKVAHIDAWRTYEILEVKEEIVRIEDESFKALKVVCRYGKHYEMIWFSLESGHGYFPIQLRVGDFKSSGKPKRGHMSQLKSVYSIPALEEAISNR